MVPTRELQIKINTLGIIIGITDNCYNILGYTAQEMINTNINKYLSYNFEDFISNLNFNVEVQNRNGINHYFDVCATPIIDNNSINSIALSFIDISKYKEIEAREEMFFKMLQKSKDIVCKYQIIPQIKFIYLSPSVENILGYKLEEYENDPMLTFKIVHPDDYQIQISKLNAKTDFSKLFEARFRHKNGHYVWLQDYVIPNYDANGQLVSIESITRNVQERKETLERLKMLGYTDNLTELFNQNYYLNEFNILNNSIDLPVGILVCDLDNLKHTNDNLGHSVGNIIIKHTAKLLKSVFTSDSLISRTGGDEFVIIIKNKSQQEVKILVDNLQSAIKIYNSKNQHTPIYLSVGFAYSEKSISAMQSTFDIADSEMYKMKKLNKQRILI